MATARVPLIRYPVNTGLSKMGMQSVVPEDKAVQLDNMFSNQDGTISRRPALDQWGQQLLVPNVDSDATVRIVEIGTNHSNFSILDTSGYPNQRIEVYKGRLFRVVSETAVSPTTGNAFEMARTLKSDETLSTSVDFSFRFNFRYIGDLAPSTPGQFYIYVKAPGSTNYWRITLNEDYPRYNGFNYEFTDLDVNDGAWHTFNVVQNGTTNAFTMWVDDFEPYSDTASPIGTTAEDYAFSVVVQENTLLTYQLLIDSFMYTDTITDPFVGAMVHSIFDWRGQNEQQLNALMVHADHYIYSDPEQQNFWQVIDEVPSSSTVYFTTFRDKLVFFVSEEAPRQWDGFTQPVALGGNPPHASFGAEFSGRLYASGVRGFPLRAYYSLTGNIDFWGIENSGVDPQDAGYFDVPDRRSNHLTGMFGNYYNQLVMWTDVQPWRLAFDNGGLPYLVGLPASNGNESPWGIAAVGNDLWYVSQAGIFGLQTTDKFGDVIPQSASLLISDFWSRDVRVERKIEFGLLGAAQMAYDSTQGNVYFLYAEQGQACPQSLLIFNLRTGLWHGPHDVCSSCAAEARIGKPEWPLILMGSNDGYIQFFSNYFGADTNGDQPTTVYKTGRITAHFLESQGGAWVTHDKGYPELKLMISPRNNGTLTVRYQCDGQVEKTQDFDMNVFKRPIIGNDFVVGKSMVSSIEETGPITVDLESDGQLLWFSLESTSDFVLPGWQLDIERHDVSRQVA